jgi:hypothetical protein
MLDSRVRRFRLLERLAVATNAQPPQHFSWFIYHLL